MRRVLPPFLVLCCALLAAAALTAPAADAHARLESATPASGARLAHAPAAVIFRFDEAVEGRFGAITVYNARGAAVRTGHAAHVDGSTSTFGATLPADLPDGQYAATFRIVSADGHPVSGGVVFGVGAGKASGAAAGLPPSLAGLIAGEEAGGVTKAGFAAVRALDDLATAIAVGLLAFLLLCWRPAIAEVAGAGRDWERASRRLAAGAWRMLRLTVVLGLAVAYLGVMFQGALAGGTPLWDALSASVVGDTLRTRFGIVWSAKFAMWLGLGAALVRGAPRGALALQPAALGADGQALGGPGGARMLALAVPALALALAPGFAGHASAQSDAWLLVPAVVVHVLAMSVWIGGLIALSTLVPRATAGLGAADRARLLCALLVRFSPLALGAVLALQLTGALQSIAYLTSFGELIDDPFGRAVLVKIVLVLVLVALGAVNRQRVLPQLRTAARGGAAARAATALLRWTVCAEVALLLIVLAVTGVLAGYAPATATRGASATVAGGASAAGTAAGDAGMVARPRLGPLRASVRLSPARIGANALRLRLRTASGAPFTGAKELKGQATLPAQGVGPLPVTFTRVQPGVMPRAMSGCSPAARGASPSRSGCRTSTSTRPPSA